MKYSRMTGARYHYIFHHHHHHVAMKSCKYVNIFEEISAVLIVFVVEG
jgi:hypothetical protein